MHFVLVVELAGILESIAAPRALRIRAPWHGVDFGARIEPPVAESAYEHLPVLAAPLLDLLEPRPGDCVLDGTVGLGGHATLLIPRIMPGGRYIGLDWDERMLAVARERLAGSGFSGFDLVAANYAAFPNALLSLGVTQVDHMLLDLGVNSAQLDDSTRGFSFDRDGPLDMRYSAQSRTRALDLVNSLSEGELADVFYEFGQEGMSRKIARRICQVRHEGRITTTLALARAVESVYSGGSEGRGKTHPATRVFQALRIAVNRELDNLKVFLTQVETHMRRGGKLAVICFHSLEDALMKQFFRAGVAGGKWEELTRRPVVAEAAERGANPRSRSAKLRVGRFLG